MPESEKQLMPGNVNVEHFRLLSEISRINSERVLLALELHFVNGLTRKEACYRTGVSISTMSVKVRQLQEVNRIVFELFKNQVNY